MAVRYPITLNVSEPNNNIGLLKIRQADEETQTLVVQILEDAIPKSYEGLQVFFCARIGQTPGLGIIEQKLAKLEMTDPKNGQLEYTFRPEDWQILGRQTGYFSFRKMTDDHTWVQQFSTRDFIYEVTKSIYSDGIKEVTKDGSTYVWTIEDLIRLFNEYIESGRTDWEEFVEQNKEIIESVDPGGIVLSELIASRTNAQGQTFASVSKRIEADVSPKTVTDYINGKYKLSNDQIVYLQGFNNVGDSGGNIYSYQAVAIDNTETWIDSGKEFKITQDGWIKLSDKQKLRPIFDSEILLGAFGANGTNDDVVFQIATDFAISNNIKLNVNVDCSINGVIDIKRPIDERNIIEISGRGVITKNTSGFLFHNSTSRNGGNIRFTGVHFESVEGAGTTIFNAGYMIRMYFNGCNFYNVDTLFYAGGSDEKYNYAQTIYISDCTIVGGSGWFLNCDIGYDISISKSIIEHREHFMRCLQSHSVRITDSLIEGMSGQVFYGVGGRSLVIENNYLESCCEEVTYPYIQISNTTLGINDFQNFSIKNNSFIGSAEQAVSSTYYLINFFYLPQSVQFGGNYADCNFVKVNYEFSLSMNIEALKILYRENVTGNKFVANGRYKRNQVTLGTGNALGKYFKHPFEKELFTLSPIDGSVLLDYYENKFRLRLYQNSTSLPPFMYMRTSKEYFIGGIDYVIGLSVFARVLGNGVGNLAVVIYDETMSAVYSHDIDIQNNSFITGKPVFYSLKPFTLSTSGNYYVAVVQRGNSNNVVTQGTAFTLENLVVQRAVIASETN